MLMRIAKCEYEWPQDRSSKFVQSEGIRRLVGRLLIREPRKRSKVKHLWDDEWMLGEGAPIPPPPPTPPLPPLNDPEDDELIDDVLEEELIGDGIIVDGDQISSIASQELQ
jgi:protein-serine/threonine kinase